ncbi:MAG: single-stranded DNA-binding protein [Actinobacteria bacterium]|nr:single-stranded DNA-binding protein [Actinomycetota bacterium]MCA1721415.1 single-stranded DNA-binding protein [Actinomycetota bacterium]
MHEPQITVTGNVAWPPRLRTLAGGAVVADFRVASTPRKLDKSTGSWSDLETMWFGVTCWRGLAENAAASLKKGDRVVVTGRLVAKSWHNEAGEERSGLEIDATAVGFDLSRGPVTQERPARTAERSSEPVPNAWETQSAADPLTGELVPEQPVAA